MINRVCLMVPFAVVALAGAVEAGDFRCPTCNRKYAKKGFCQDDATPLKAAGTSCSKCGKSYPPGTKFCNEDGTRLEAAGTSCSKCGKSYPPGTKFCNEDGTKLSSGASTCPKCGTTYKPGTEFCAKDGSKIGGGSSSGGGAKKANISHVKVGQKYEYHMSSPAKMDMTYEVTGVSDTEIKYTITSFMNGKQLGPATPLTWSVPLAAGEADPDAAAVSYETVKVAGHTWNCMVVEAGGSRTWIPLRDGMPTWPLFIKQMRGRKVTLTLTKMSGGEIGGFTASQEPAAIGALKTISTAQALFREADKDANGDLDYAASIGALARTRLIDRELGSGTKQGYRFKVTRGSEYPEFIWMATANPISGSGRYFVINHEGVIYYSSSPFSHRGDCEIKGGIPIGNSPGNMAGNPAETSAIGSLKSLGASQALFREGDKDANGEIDYAASLGALGRANLIDRALAGGTKNGYRFKVTRGSEDPEFVWMATANPISGRGRHFAINHEGVVFYSNSSFRHRGDCRLEGGKPIGK